MPPPVCAVGGGLGFPTFADAILFRQPYVVIVEAREYGLRQNRLPRCESVLSRCLLRESVVLYELSFVSPCRQTHARHGSYPEPVIVAVANNKMYTIKSTSYRYTFFFLNALTPKYDGRSFLFFL